MQPDSQKLLWDALQAADRVARFLEGRNFENYCLDEQLRSAVERQLEIVGEALARWTQNRQRATSALPSASRAL